MRRLIYHADSDQPLTTPVGFVLTREWLITVRFEELSHLVPAPVDSFDHGF